MAAEEPDSLKAVAARLLPCLDLTSLNDDDTPEKIAALCRRAMTPFGKVAAVCVWPRFVAQAHELLRDTGVRVATVVNFPHGTGLPREVEPEIECAIADGVDEIDMVIPLGPASNGRNVSMGVLCRRARSSCGTRTLKLILETGRLRDQYSAFDLAVECIRRGADFIKTSTGKIPVGATPDAAQAMLLAISECSLPEYAAILARMFAARGEEFPEYLTVLLKKGETPLGRKLLTKVTKAAAQENRKLRGAHSMPVGFKASGGIRTVTQAKVYVDLADNVIGPDYVRPATFRIGASGLLDDILAVLGGAPAIAGSAAY